MSKVTDALIKEIADAINTQQPQSTETRLIGTIDSLYVAPGDTDTSRKYYKVQLDGSDELTPALATCACEIGDRVMVTIGDHSATITGNLSSALFIKSVEAYIQLVSDGLIVGTIDEQGLRTGGYIKLKGQSIEFYSSGGEKLATYGSGSIILGPDASPMATFGTGSIVFGPTSNPLATFSPSLVNLLRGAGVIKVDEDKLLMQGNRATGLRAEDAYGNRAEVAVRAVNGFGAALQMQIAGVTQSIILNGTNAVVTVPYGGLIVNGNQVVDVGSLFCKGRVKLNGNVNAGDSRVFSTTAAVPSGYRLCAIKELMPYFRQSNGNYSASHYLQIMNFSTDSTNNSIAARIYNSSSNNWKVRVVLEWVALRASGIVDEGEIDIDLDG